MTLTKRFGSLFLLAVALLILTTACGSGQDKKLAKELHICNWPDYFPRQIYADFETKFGVRVIEDSFESNEDLLEKLRAESNRYDVIVPSDYMVKIMITEGLLAELERPEVPNLGLVDPKFKDPPYDPTMAHCVPYLWGTTGIGYNTTVFNEAPDSWGYLFDPQLATQYAGRFTMLDDGREAMGAALKYLGYSVNSSAQAELVRARDLLKQQKQWVYAYDSETYDRLLNVGHTVMAHGWNGDILRLSENNSSMGYAVPKEGSIIWADNLCIPQNAPNPYTAHVFINYLMQPEVAAAMTNDTWDANTITTATELVKPEIRQDSSIYPSPEVMGRLEWLRDMEKVTVLYEQFWTEVQDYQP